MIRGEDIPVLDEMFDSRKTFFIPVYQRNYDWKKEQCNKLIHDIEKAVDRDAKEYFIGSFVLVKKEDDKKSFYIIDGQQRITTIVLLLLAILDYAKNNNDTLKTSIEKFIFSDVKEHSGRLFLKQIQKDDEYLNKILNDEEIKEGTSNIINNYLFFKEKLNNDEKYISKLWKGLDLLKGIRITLEQEDEPQIIFETLNATGLSLKEGDKIRNYVLMYKNQDRLYKDYWIKIEENCMQNLDDESVSTFIRFFLAIENKEFSKESEVYNDFKKYLENKDNEEVLKKLLEYSKLYNIILDTSKEKNKNVKIKLDNIKELKANVLNPLIMLFLKYRNEQIISEDILFDSLHLLENYILRRLICSRKTNDLNKICISIIKKLYIFFENKKDMNTIVDYLSNILIDLKGNGEFPDNITVENSIIEKDVYKNILAKFILTKLELLNSKEKIDIDNITIEHIMPRTLTDNWKKLIGDNYKEIHDKYVNTIGNLTLTGYNSELSNKSLEEKQEMYKDSKFLFLNKDILDLKIWNENIIIERSKRLIKKLLEYYKYPEVINQIDDEIKDYSLDDSIDFSGMNIYSFEYKNNKYDVAKWAGFISKILTLIYEEDSVKFNQFIFKDDTFKNKISNEEFFYNYGKATKTESNFFVNTDTDTNAKIKLLINVLDKLNISTDEITLYIKKK
ncbi:DUF262 domain-containing HNH endonuclease family protein [Brachyspira hyodysenteriae]|uniref:DUF262 domain-containing protein n=2 Tax=Brachyspira hyodysenteriae TaxID=159 RepID=UPI00063DD5DC|nr:DUF262 domain-containing protein [Brachyspira hyodysenteriae]KLI17825.1 hypothetical protein SU44_03555 [Brachyspira hyodysenteriae]KLI19046.1 hypothetical protein SU45_00830 [Brachyspira hyodysenteriae]KLI21959.1 hypothetical protein SU46_00910 [Brachyspira hyodysenteriae]KLI22196.1 hypothetical protein SU43_09250 [Brachyspira hyodysenteriae]KLI33528.1 hypothetical protein SZ48_08940 [Brachyspira hyodysenteriae]